MTSNKLLNNLSSLQIKEHNLLKSLAIHGRIHHAYQIGFYWQVLLPRFVLD